MRIVSITGLQLQCVHTRIIVALLAYCEHYSHYWFTLQCEHCKHYSQRAPSCNLIMIGSVLTVFISLHCSQFLQCVVNANITAVSAHSYYIVSTVSIILHCSHHLQCVHANITIHSSHSVLMLALLVYCENCKHYWLTFTV